MSERPVPIQEPMQSPEAMLQTIRQLKLAVEQLQRRVQELERG